MITIQAQSGVDAAFDMVAQELFRVLKQKKASEPLVVGLCGGRSVVGLLKALRRAATEMPKELISRLHFFMVDERLVPLEDEQSNYGGLYKLLFEELLKEGMIEASQLHPFVPDEKQTDYGCLAYYAELRRFGGRFTAVVVGVGEDGHIAGLFPRHPVLQRTEPGFISFFDSPKAPSERMSATKALITTADVAVVIALGEAKRDAWRHFGGDSTAVEDCPALLAKGARECIVVTDL